MRVLMTAALLLGLAGPPALAEDAVEPAALDALRTMGAHLAGMQAFSIAAGTQLEVVLDDDQKLLIGGQVDYLVRRPDRLRITLSTDVLHREFYYDGSTASYVAPDQRYYARVDKVPGTIAGMLEEAAQKYSLVFPLADLFAWGSDNPPVDDIKEGFHVGRARVNGVATEHWAYRGDDQDWEVWIRAEGDPLPLRVSTVDRTDPTHPRFTATLDWTTVAPAEDGAFAYQPAEGVARIPLHETDLGGEKAQ